MAGTLTALLLALAAAFGVYLLFVGMSRGHSLALYAHVGTSIAGLFLLLLIVHARAHRAGAGPPLGGMALERRRDGLRRSFLRRGGLYQRAVPNQQYIIHNPSTAPLSMEQEGAGTASLAFPSSAQTADGKTIKAEFFLNSESCKPCHTDIYNQWQSSMHHMASFNNQWYRKSIEYMQDTNGVKPSLWCGGCHDHALVFTG